MKLMVRKHRIVNNINNFKTREEVIHFLSSHLYELSEEELHARKREKRYKYHAAIKARVT